MIINNNNENAGPEQVFYLMDLDFGSDPELSGFFSRIGSGLKKAFTPPAKIRNFLKRITTPPAKIRKLLNKIPGPFRDMAFNLLPMESRFMIRLLSKGPKGVKIFLKKRLAEMKKALPIVLNMLAPGAGAEVAAVFEKAGGPVMGKVGSISEMSKMLGTDTKAGLKKVITRVGAKMKGGGSGLFKNNTDIVNKLVSLKSKLKNNTSVSKALIIGKSLGFKPKQISSMIVDGAVKIKKKVFNTRLFKYGSKPNYFVGVARPEGKDMIRPIIKTDKGERPIYKLFQPEYFHEGGDDYNDLELKFLTGLIEKAKGVFTSGTEAVKETAAKIFPSKEEREEKEQAELLKKKLLLVKNIQTLENSLSNIKKEYAVKKRSLSSADNSQLLKDINYVTTEIGKMKAELEKMSSLDQDGGDSLAIAPLIVIGVAGALAYLGAKIVDTVKMHKVMARDKLILSRVEGGITPSQASAIIGRPVVTTRKETAVKARFEMPGLLPIAVIAGGGLLLYVISRRKGKRRRKS